MMNFCPRCNSSDATRIQRPSSSSASSQLGMAALGTQLAKHIPLPMPFGQLAGGLLGSILGQTIDEHSSPSNVILRCNNCHYQYY